MNFKSVIFAGMALSAAALAQDPPARVARLAYLNGQVSFQPAGVDDWTAATLNYPLTTGDHLFTDPNSSAEIRLGPNAIRIAHQTNTGFLNLDDRTVQLRLTEGSVDIRVGGLGDQDVWEVDTPNGAVSLLRTGEYRIDTDPNRNATMVTVRGGEAEVTANGQSFPVHARQTGYFTGDGQQQSIQSANPPDDFDHFSEERNHLEDQAPPPRYVSENMIGYEDLDRNGTWEAQSEYGPIWRPRVRAGWSPYHEGHWVFREPWGWTWIDDAPWGFAPFHYGRWAYVGGGWGWCPGPVLVARPVYAPALVAFVGGAGFGVSVGFGGGGGVGWFPLGPREIYAPAYRVSPAYIRQVNITNVREINNTTINNIVVNRNVTNVYVNQNAPGAITAVSRQDFVSSRSVARAYVQVSPQQLRSAQVTGFTPGVAPQRESFGRMAGNVPQPQQAVFNRPVIARTAPPAPPILFAARQQALQSNGGRPLAPEQMNALRTSQPASQQFAVRSAVSPSQGFGRNEAGAPGNAPIANGAGFGRTTSPIPGNQPQAAPQPNTPENSLTNRPQERFGSRPPQATPQTNSPAVNNGGFGRNAASQQNAPQAVPPAGAGRPQDRFESRPPQTTPQSGSPAVNNSGFGRNATSQQNAPQAAPPAANDRAQGRFESRPPQATPQTNNPAENRGGFGRNAAPQPTAPPTAPPAANGNPGRSQDRLESRPSQAAPPITAPSENRGFGRNAAPQQAPPPSRTEAPAQNRGFERPAPQREQAPAARVERPAENRVNRDAQPKAEKPKDERKDHR